MPQQPNLFSTTPPGRSTMTRNDGGVPPAIPVPPRKRTMGQRFGNALIATEFLLAIMVRIFIGVIVFVLPWSPFWDSNHLLQSFPRLAQLFSYGATRGIFSGIGLLNLWVAVEETLHRSQRHL